MGLDQLDEFLIRIGNGMSRSDTRFPNIQIDFPRFRADVAEIGVGHFSWPLTVQPMMAILTPGK